MTAISRPVDVKMGGLTVEEWIALGELIEPISCPVLALAVCLACRRGQGARGEA